MKWNKEDRMLEGDRWLLSPFEEWRQFFEDCNWYTFHPLSLEFENDKHLGGFEITVIVLGLGLRWRWNHTETETMAEIKNTIAGIKAGEIETVPVDLPGSRSL